MYCTLLVFRSFMNSCRDFSRNAAGIHLGVFGGIPQEILSLFFGQLVLGILQEFLEESQEQLLENVQLQMFEKSEQEFWNKS